MTLYDLESNFTELFTLFQSGEIDAQTFSDTLQAMEFDTDFENKADGYAKAIINFNADNAKIKAERDRLNLRIKANEKMAEMLKNRLCGAMKTVNKTKFKTAFFTYNIRRNPPAAVIAADAEIPDEYLRYKDPEPDKTALKDALKEGIKISGITLEHSESLIIK
jgi:hypothetical protein